MIRRAVVLCLLAGSPALAADAPAAGPATVTTHATARDRLPNTVADVQLSIESHGRTLPEVQAALGQASPPLLAYLNGAGAQRLRTAAVDVRPELDTSVSGRPPRVTGYTGRLTTGFEIEAGRLGAVLTEALSHGATSIDDATLHPRQSEIDAARDRLAAAATRLALAQAAAVAEAAGRKPGAPRSIEVEAEGGSARRFSSAMPVPVMALAAKAAPMATEAGDSEMTVSVTIVTTLAEP